jgi:hypothetical protein
MELLNYLIIILFFLQFISLDFSLYYGLNFTNHFIFMSTYIFLITYSIFKIIKYFIVDCGYEYVHKKDFISYLEITEYFKLPYIAYLIYYYFEILNNYLYNLPINNLIINPNYLFPFAIYFLYKYNHNIIIHFTNLCKTNNTITKINLFTQILDISKIHIFMYLYDIITNYHNDKLIQNIVTNNYYINTIIIISYLIFYINILYWNLYNELIFNKIYIFTMINKLLVPIIIFELSIYFYVPSKNTQHGYFTFIGMIIIFWLYINIFLHINKK